MTNPKLSEVILVVDMSGSMYHLTQDTIRNISNFIQEQKEVPGEANFTLVYFNDSYEVRLFRQNLKDVSSKQDYKTAGMTALRDALGTIIDRIGGELSRTLESDRPAHVILCCITDGLENASVKYNHSQLKSMIEVQQNVFNWKFIFMGTEKNSLLDAQSWGIPSANTLQYTPDSAGLAVSYRGMSNTTKSFRTDEK